MFQDFEGHTAAWLQKLKSLYGSWIHEEWLSPLDDSEILSLFDLPA